MSKQNEDVVLEIFKKFSSSVSSYEGRIEEMDHIL